MGSISDYALERAIAATEQRRQGRRRRANVEPGNVPTAVRDAQVREKIRELFESGLDRESLTEALLVWNANQPSPMSVGEIKKRLHYDFSHKTQT